MAWAPLGWRPLAFAEVDAFPSAVLRERFPSVPNLGDVTKVNWRWLGERIAMADEIPPEEVEW